MHHSLLLSTLAASAGAFQAGAIFKADASESASVSWGNASGKNASELNSTVCCRALADAGIKVLYPGSYEYQNQTDEYWSVTARLNPTCYAEPLNTAQVSTALTTLVQKTTCNFAVRSGGHMIWAGASNIDDGVTLDLSQMNSTSYNEATMVASIDAGTRWGPVYAALEPYGVTVAGGRAAHVGIAGFLTGGGNTFFSARKGFGCDNVVNFEVVLANGIVVNANASSNADLFQALKGGQSNFGIVTRFDMHAFEAGNLWGGAVITDRSTGDAQLDAYVNWTNAVGVDGNVNGSAITFYQYNPSYNKTVIISAYDDTYGAENATEFSEFLAIMDQPGALMSSTLRQASHYELVTELNQPDGYRDIWWTGTIKNDRRVYDKFIALHDDLVTYMQGQVADGNFITQCMFQAIPTVFSEHGTANGGNVLGLDRETEPVVMLLFTLAVKTEALQTIAQEQVKKLGEETMAYAESVDAKVQWEYINYAYGYQDPLASYGEENVAKIKAVAKKYDPNGVFQTRAPGGFKISNSNGTVA